MKTDLYPSPALAGVGMGGVAIAFGAQKTVENLLGGIFLLTDRVLAVGDTCRIGDRVGTVEDITLRSVRLRTKKTRLSPARHYLFPHRINGNAHCGTYDPRRHQTTCKTAWKKLTVAANLPRLRPYDCRHCAITNLPQNPDVSEETVKAIAGHVSPEILKTYFHIRLEAQQAALDALVKKSFKGKTAMILEDHPAHGMRLPLHSAPMLIWSARIAE